MNIMKKTKLMAISLMMLCVGLALNFTATVQAGEPNMADIISTVERAENAIQDVKIDYTCSRRPYESQGRDLTPAEQSKINSCPGWFRQESGAWMQKGNKIRLERTYYRGFSGTEEVEDTIAFDGSTTIKREHSGNSHDLGLISDDRWHGFRKWFNPLLTFSASGDKRFSEELRDVATELVAGLHNVSGKSCRLVKLYKKTPSGTILRSFNVYVDPNSNYTPIKIEKYWYNFQCLERTVEVKELAKVGDVYIASKALCVTYNRPHKSRTSNPVCEQELTVTNVEVNRNMTDSAFELSLLPGTRVWNSIVKEGYTIPDLPPEL